MCLPAWDVHGDVEQQSNGNDHPDDEPQHLVSLSDPLPLLEVQRLPESPDLLYVEVVGVHPWAVVAGEESLGPLLRQQHYPEHKMSIFITNTRPRGQKIAISNVPK